MDDVNERGFGGAVFLEEPENGFACRSNILGLEMAFCVPLDCCELS